MKKRLSTYSATSRSHPTKQTPEQTEQASVASHTHFSWHTFCQNDRFQWVELGLFMLFAWWFFGWRYADFLYFAQNNDLFLYDRGYFAAHLVELGGLHDYLISFVMQFFYFPFWGGLILAIFATAMVAMTASLLRLRGVLYPLAMIPATLILIFVVRMGYMLVEFMLFRFCFGMLTGVTAALALGLLSGYLYPIPSTPIASNSILSSPSTSLPSALPKLSRTPFCKILRRRFWFDVVLFFVSYPIFGGFAILGSIIAWCRSIRDALLFSTLSSTELDVTSSLATSSSPDSSQSIQSYSVWRLFFAFCVGRLALWIFVPIFYYQCFYIHRIAWSRLWFVGLETEGSPITDLVGTSNLYHSFAGEILLVLAVMMSLSIAIQWVISKRRSVTIVKMTTKTVAPTTTNVSETDSAQTSFQMSTSSSDARSRSLQRLIPLLVILILFTLTVRYDSSDPTFLPALAMGRAMEADRWQNVIEYENRCEHPSFPMIALRNLALFELNESANWFFSYPQTTSEPMIGRIYTDEILYRYGMLNHAQRAAMNQLVMNDYLAVGPLRVLTAVAVAQRNPALARRYLRLLDRTWFHRDWAKQWELILAKEEAEQRNRVDSTSSSLTTSQNVRPTSTESAEMLKNIAASEYTEALEMAKFDLAKIRRRVPVVDTFNRGTQAQAVLWGRMLTQPHDPQDAPEIQELQLVYRLMVGEMDEFIRQLDLVFRAKNEDPLLNPTGKSLSMPRHFQEALLLWLFRHPEISTVDRSAFSPDILEEYRICEPFLIQHRQTNDLRTLQKQLHDSLPQTYWRFGSEKPVCPFDPQVN